MKIKLELSFFADHDFDSMISIFKVAHLVLMCFFSMIAKWHRHETYFDIWDNFNHGRREESLSANHGI